MIKPLNKVISRHKEWPSLDVTLNLERWNLKDNINDRFKNKKELTEYIGNELKLFWRFANSHSLLGLVTDKKSIINRFWKKRPTNFEVFYSDGTSDNFLIEYSNDKYSELYLTAEDMAEVNKRKVK